MKRSRKKTGAAGRARRAALLFAGLLAASPLLYLVGRTAAAAMSPIAAAQLPPDDQAPLLRLRIYETLLPGRRVRPELLARARRMALDAPLAFEPFFIEARAAEQRGRFGRAVMLMEEARRRRPNFLPTRLQLLTYYASARRYDDLIAEMDVVLRLSGDARPLVMPELVKLIADRDGRRALATMLARNPDWRRDFFAVALNRTFRPEHALDLLDQMRAREPRGDFALPRQLYLQSLLNAGQVPRARALWLAGLPAAQRERHALLFNGDFRPARAQPPFGWLLHDLDVGRAELVAVGAERPHLRADYFGGRNVILAEQVLALRPGAYRLTYLARSDGGVRSGNLFWRIGCMPGGEELVRSPVGQPPERYAPRRTAFTVPASGCPGQKLELHAEAGDVAVPVNVQIAGLGIAR